MRMNSPLSTPSYALQVSAAASAFCSRNELWHIFLRYYPIEKQLPLHHQAQSDPIRLSINEISGSVLPALLREQNTKQLDLG
jgi:hypothetical protein